MPPRNGIVHTSGSTDGQREHLVLEEMRARLLILDMAARVAVTQKYRNPLNTATSRATYYFPVPANAAICSFEMTTCDGRVLKASCKEKTKAREEHEQALALGQETSLLEWVADDVFTISVGSIPAGETVSTKLVFTMTLANDDNVDEIRLQLPSYVGERYGPPLPGLEEAIAPSSSTRIRITTEIQTSGRIQSITSPSHPDEIVETRYKTHLGRPSRRRSTVRFVSSTFLDRDFVLVVQAEGLDEPRCFAELNRTPNRSDTLALQFTIVPNFKLPPVAGQEYIFLIDRSGSMVGPRIDTAKSTLKLLLRMLPSHGSTFNIFSFSRSHSSLWLRAAPYNQQTLDEASSHVDSMQADFGTEIRAALNAVFASRTGGIATAVFVLTDGEVNDYDQTVSDIQTAVRAGTKDHPLRVFCLGIGDGISTAMCEGIARAGNGVCLFAVHTESMLGKCARLFSAGRSPFVENVTIDWGIPDENLTVRSPTVNFSNPSPYSIRLQPTPAIQQSPSSIPQIHTGTRLNVYAILALRKTTVPKEVVLRGQLNGGRNSFELTVPIRGIQLADSEPGLPLVHTLAAWRLIQDHQERVAPPALPIGIATEEEIRKAAIVRLGERGKRLKRRRRVRSPSPRPISDTESVTPKPRGLREMLKSIFNPEPAEKNEAADDFPGAWPDSASSSPASDHDDPGRNGGYESDATFSTMSSLDGSSEWSDWSDTPPPVSEEDAQMQRSPSPKLESVRLAPPQIRAERAQQVTVVPIQPPPPPPVKPEIIQLASLQLSDGSFDDSIRAVVGGQILDEAGVLHVDAVVWATAVSYRVPEQSSCNARTKRIVG
ncbi:hypothetical protein FB45DRAFT_1027697 [Roridomyces roridus]|uniref:VWFA domain-containing protein n=1 Tax=Roridomyces roridus TaxID=1738132 RepID=A0AAD7FP99_9AGAR|nr:hypothetical protein FB45DRAFT_1027697 [Roridomyces roridus]